jgi:flagellar hook protein FlgE
MSIFGALSTAVSGINAQSSAFSNISDNVANSQTTGFKRIDTNVVDYLTTSTQAANDSGSVVARPEYQNEVQGTITQSDNPLAMAISGQGFFQVSQETGVTQNGATLSNRVEYSRNGDFKLDNSGYLVNGSGQVLNGWSVDPATGVTNQNKAAPIKISQSSFSPIATSSVTLAANLPATPASATPMSPSVDVYDAKGTLHTVSLNFTRNGNDDWTVSVNSPDATTPALGSAELKFGAASGNAVAAGTIGSVTNPSGSVTAGAFSANGNATLGFTADFGGGPQAVSLNLGTFGGASGVTQFAGTAYTLRGLTQNGVPPGAFKNVTAQSSGAIVVNYDNGQSRTVAQVPLISFANADQLQRQDGQAFTATTGSGVALAQDASNAGSGHLVTSSVESSNVDIAAEFTKLIVAQRAYSANTKLVTTAEDLLTQTIDMKR